jgi:rubredoxin/mono/diheme cytochrome c family protein
MACYECPICGYVHDESSSGELWGELPDGWTCPICGASKSQFERMAETPAVDEDDGDQASNTTVPTAPRNPAILIHRIFGFVFLAIYVVLMFEMLPRLWTYQIEFPARTVVHFSLGMAVGVMLLIKIGIVRFFRRLDQSLVPMLGTSLLISSVVLIGISVPAAFREAAATARLFTPENRERVAQLLGQTGLDEEACTRLAQHDSLRAGQQILRQQCIDCHDLRTVLARPRTPTSWRQTVSRMADRAQLFRPLGEEEQLQVTAYLVALSPNLQQSARQLRDAEQRRTDSIDAAAAVNSDQVTKESYDAAKAKQLFESKCSQCHQADLVKMVTLGSREAVQELVERMVVEGLEGSEVELKQIIKYLTDTNVKSSE